MWVERSGRVCASALSVAPVSGRRCVLYRVELTLTQRAYELRHGAVREKAGARFSLLTDDGAELLVEARDATLAWRGERLVVDASPYLLARRVVGALDAQRPGRIAELYARLGRGRPRARVRIREWCLEPGAAVRIAGWMRRVVDAGGEGSYRARPQRLLIEAARIDPR